MQIGHYMYTTYATMIKNKFSDICLDLWINPAEATIVVPNDLRMYDRLIVGLVLWYMYYFISREFVFWFIFSAILKVFRTFGDR